MIYGVPYQGSKNRILPYLLDELPQANTFVDLFAGGCAVTHAALLSGKYDNFVINDIGFAHDLFIDAVNGKYHDEKRWISREEFFEKKDNDPFIKYFWSWNAEGKSYLYGKDREEYKKALHYQKMFNDDSLLERYLKEQKELYEQLIRDKNKEQLRRLRELQNVQRLNRLHNLERLNRLEGFQNIKCFHLDYHDVVIPDGSLIYCDPPYKDTTKYDKQDFNHQEFYEWCEEQTAPLFISEFNMPDDRFVCVWENKRIPQYGNRKTSIKERLYRPIHQM